MYNGFTDCIDYDYSALNKLIGLLCGRYPKLKSFTIGKSCAGRDIQALKIGNASEYSLIAAAVHGSEHITTNVLMMFAEELCEALENDSSVGGLNARKALFKKGIIFIPRANPDGCEISIHGAAGCAGKSDAIRNFFSDDFKHYNANLRGVDLNHNFDAGFKEVKSAEQKAGIYGPSGTRYGGSRPESEPETVALCDICRKINIRQLLALHTQGEVIYWTYGENRPSRSERMAEIMASSANYILDTPDEIASAGGYKDWFIEKFNRPGFTAELGLGQNPLPAESARSIYERVREMLMLFSVM